MKILITGYTALQQASDRRPIQKIDVPGLIVAELRRQGHEVDWRPFVVGEEPSGYDGAIVCMGPCCSPTSYRCLGAMWLLSRSLPTILFHDDWQTRAVKSHHGTFMRFADAQLEKRWSSGTRFYYATPEEALASRRRRSALFEVARRFYEDDPQPWWRANLYPQYRWGDRDALDKQGVSGLERLTVDPSAMIDLLPRIELAEGLRAPKAREWFLASLMPHDGWVEKKMKPEWPVVYVGSRKLKAERLKTELDVQARTRESWGTLAPGYSGVATGWWRSRFLYAARSRTILVTDPGVDAILGEAYSLTCAEVESAGEGRKGGARLQELAEAQADAMLGRVGTRETFADEVRAMAEILR